MCTNMCTLPQWPMRFVLCHTRVHIRYEVQYSWPTSSQLPGCSTAHKRALTSALCVDRAVTLHLQKHCVLYRKGQCTPCCNKPRSTHDATYPWPACDSSLKHRRQITAAAMHSPVHKHDAYLTISILVQVFVQQSRYILPNPRLL